jgi:hypothetical protein
MAPPIITPVTFNTPLYHYLVVLKNLADDFANLGYTEAPISVVQLPSNVAHASGTGFFESTTGKSTNPTIAAFLCPSGILTPPSASFGMDYIRLFPGQSSSVVLQASSTFSSIPSGAGPFLSSIVSSFPSSGATFRYHILSGVNSEPYYIYEERSGARNLDIARNWTITDFDYVVAMYKQAEQKISSSEIAGDYYITSGNSGPSISYHFYLRNNYQTKYLYTDEYDSYQSSSNFLTDPTMYYIDTSSSNGEPQILPNYIFGTSYMINRDYQSTVSGDYVFGTKNIGTGRLQTIYTVRATAYLDGTVYANQTIPNFVSTTFIVGGDLVNLSANYASGITLPNVQLSGAGLGIENSFLSMMSNYFNNFNPSTKLNDTINTELNLRTNLYVSVIRELLQTTGAKDFLDGLP